MPAERSASARRPCRAARFPRQPSQITDDAAAERDDHVAPLQPSAENSVHNRLQLIETLGFFARPYGDDFGTDARRVETCRKAADMAGRGDIGVGDDCGARSRGSSCDLVAGALDKSRSDEDVVGSAGEGHGNFRLFAR